MPTRKISRELTLSAMPEIQAKQSEEGDKLATFAIKAYTGGVMQVGGFYDPVVIELSGIKPMAKSIPILSGHQHDRIVGHSTEITSDKGRVQVNGVISGVGFYAREVLDASANGFPWQASVGARIDKAVFLEEGSSREVNGKLVKGPVVIAQRSTLTEVSFVPVGADQRTSATVVAEVDPSSSSMEIFDMSFDDFVAELGFDLEKLSEKQKAYLQAKFDEGLTAAETKKVLKEKKKTPAKTVTAQVDDSITRTREEAAAESDRIASINAMSRKPDFESVPKLAELRASALREGWSTDKFELECRRDARPKPEAFAVHTSDDDRRNEAQVLECAVARQCGGLTESNLEDQYSEQVLEASTDKKYQGAGIHMLFDRAIEATGRHWTGSRKSNDFIKAGLRANNEILANEGFSTLAVSQILENVANKQLIAGYSAVNVTWPMFCGVHSMNDFKVHSRYRLDSQGSFRVVPSSGEIKHVSLSDDKYTKQLDTYGAILALNRQQIINDDLNAFMEIPRLLGRMAAIRLEEAVYTLLLANPNDFFHADNNNLLTAAFDLAALSDAEELFLNQVDSNGKPILLSPSKLLVPTSLKVEAEDVFAQTTVDQMLFTDTAGKVVARNPHKGKYPPISSPYINNTAITDENGEAITGQTATQWYLFCDPAVRTAIAVGLLNGNRVPVLESDETDFNTLGMQWRAYHDFGVGMEDPKAAVKSTGAA